MRRLLLLTAVLFVGLANLIAHLRKEKQQQQILLATVMISITTPNWQQMAGGSEEALPIPPDEYRVMARADGDVVADGLGTVVAHGDETLLITHDHWSHFDEALGMVTFRAADGTWLAEMKLRTFRQQLRYRDGGTMVLAAPDVLATAVPGKVLLHQTTALSTGDRVFLAQQADNHVLIAEARALTQTEKQGVPVVRLQSEDGQVVGGDSGGGVWLNGRLAGTMWTKVMMEDPVTGERQATEMSVAAIYRCLCCQRKPVEQDL
jgi:hypothetical protein